MYNNQEIAFKIKQTAKDKKVTVKQLLEECNLNVNYISQFANGRDMTAGNLYKIASLLDVSIDYLLGRTETPTGYGNSISNVQTTVNSPQVSGNNNSVSGERVGTVSDEELEILELIRKLSLKKRVEFISALYNETEGT
ncbi:MAG: helix-turn-helix domain-containing protein [Lachnospiraceae bacterium]|nr:helix-turn-helix domain-containing protein [Lachnospiraceae bacterium]